MFKKKVRRSLAWKKNNKLIDFEKAKELRRQNREASVKAHQAAEEEPSRREINQKNRRRNFYAVVMVIVISVIGFSVFNVISANNELAAVLAEKEKLEKEKEALLYELQNVDKDEYVEQRARDALKMIKPGEIYYIVPEETE